MRYLLSLTFITFLLFPSLSFGFDQGDLNKLKATNKCFLCDLRDANLSGANLNGANLIRANLSDANLSGANLNRADLSGANLSFANLSDADLIGAYLWNATLTGVDLGGANLKNAFLSNAFLTGAKLGGANLNGANLIRANLSDANLSGANLNGADLSGANLRGANLQRASFDGANLKDIKNPPPFLKNIIKKFEQIQIAEEKRKAEKARKVKEKAIKRRSEAALNPGFKDIKPGFTKGDIYEVSKCRLSNYPQECYGLDNIKFRGQFSKDILHTLYVDLGPIIQGSGILYTLNEYLGSDSGNIYTKLYQSFKSKYKLAYEFNERDRQLFNEGEKKHLYAVFENGQVALHIERIEKDYSSKLMLIVEYRDKDRAKNFVKYTKPKRASTDDF